MEEQRRKRLLLLKRELGAETLARGSRAACVKCEGDRRHEGRGGETVL